MWISYSGSDKESQYQIFNINGKIVSNGNFCGGSSPVRIDLPDLPGGEYLFKLINNGKTVGTRKLIIAKL
jgi:hypothetical protein